MAVDFNYCHAEGYPTAPVKVKLLRRTNTQR